MLYRPSSEWRHRGGLPVGAAYAVVSYTDSSGVENLFVGMNSGLYRAADNGAQWTLLNEKAIRGLAVAPGPGGGHYLYMLNDQLSLKRSGDNGITWVDLIGGYAGTLAVSPDDMGGFFLYASVGPEVYRTPANGADWIELGLVAKASINALGKSVDSTGKTIVFAGTQGDGLYRSTDYGLSWTQVTTGDTITSFAASGTTVFAGTGRKGVLRSTDEGRTWQSLRTGLTTPSSLALNCLLTASSATGNDTTVLAGTRAGIYRSSDKGATWAASNDGIMGTILSLANDDSTVYAGTDFYGLYLSTDTGLHWAHPSGYTGGDSLPDLFPLAEGNHWVYGWYSYIRDRIAPQTIDSGTVDYRVSHKIVIADSVRWFLMERRRLRHGPPGGDDGLWTWISDSTLFQIVEKLQGTHQLIRDPAYADYLPAGPFAFYRQYYGAFGWAVDTGKIYRYGLVDSRGTFVNERDLVPGFNRSHFTYTFRRDVGLIEVNQSGYWSLGGDYEAHSVLRQAEFPGSVSPVCALSSKKLFVSTVLGTTSEYKVNVSNPGSGTLLLRVAVSNPHFSAYLDKSTVPAYSSTTLRIRYLYTTAMHDTARIELISNTINSPDTIMVVVNAGGGTTVAFNPTSLFISDNEMGALRIPRRYPVTITNTGPAALVIDSVGSDNISFTGVHRLVSLAAGASDLDTIEFRPLEIGELKGHIIFYSNSISSPDTVAVRGYATYGTAPLYSLVQNYPNPFNSQTSIPFDLLVGAHVTLKVFNILGQEVATLVNQDLGQGLHLQTFDGKNLGSGMYIYRLTIGKYSENKKMILLK
jgi:photosystem II stability/assembly factor-like uncharacterized protein